MRAFPDFPRHIVITYTDEMPNANDRASLLRRVDLLPLDSRSHRAVIDSKIGGVQPAKN